MKLYDSGIYLVNGRDIVEEENMTQPVSREEAARNTMAYGILEAHNTSGNMQKLQIKFDKLTSHDITFVGIIQTARASGLEKFPIPYVLTNCHNSLCAVGGTINEGGFDKMRYSISNTAEYGDYRTGKRLITEDTRKEMKQVLTEIQDGTFASEFIQEFNAGGKAKFLATRKMEASHLLCSVGAELRKMMSWLKK